MDAVPGQQEWKVQLKSNLALCLMEAGRAAEAQKMAEEAYVLAKEHVKPLVSKVWVGRAYRSRPASMGAHGLRACV